MQKLSKTPAEPASLKQDQFLSSDDDDKENISTKGTTKLLLSAVKEGLSDEEEGRENKATLDSTTTTAPVDELPPTIMVETGTQMEESRALLPFDFAAELEKFSH